MTNLTDLTAAIAKETAAIADLTTSVNALIADHGSPDQTAEVASLTSQAFANALTVENLKKTVDAALAPVG